MFAVIVWQAAAIVVGIIVGRKRVGYCLIQNVGAFVVVYADEIGTRSLVFLAFGTAEVWMTNATELFIFVHVTNTVV